MLVSPLFQKSIADSFPFVDRLTITRRVESEIQKSNNIWIPACAGMTQEEQIRVKETSLAAHWRRAGSRRFLPLLRLASIGPT
jgi:hypothetical protein